MGHGSIVYFGQAGEVHTEFVVNQAAKTKSSATHSETAPSKHSIGVNPSAIFGLDMLFHIARYYVYMWQIYGDFLSQLAGKLNVRVTSLSGTNYVA